MSTISEFWAKSKDTFETKSLAQILSFTGDGKLKDNNSTSIEFRELLDQVPSDLLQKFSDSCLIDKFEDSGFALQDIINQIGIRLGFTIKNGLYRGKSTEIGFDGIWTSKDSYNIIVEVKTTDAYRINLDTLAEYRTRLIEQKIVDAEHSSILIVVGRQDTGDLEAQIRGSKHAWDVRLISTDSLLNLLRLKENLNDTKTIQQINELLKPREYTRIDKLIELIFLASQDLQIDESVDDEVSLDEEEINQTILQTRTTPVNFHQECLKRISLNLKVNLIKQSRITYTNKEKTLGLIIAVSKTHKQGQNEKYWFAFHPHQRDFLADTPDAFVAYGCGTADKTFLIPYKEFEPLVTNMWKTESANRMYWHIVINERNNRFFLAQPYNALHDYIEITQYLI